MSDGGASRSEPGTAPGPGGPVPLEDPAGFAGEPDGMQRLWTPHRMAYISGEAKPDDPGDVHQCPFCLAPARTDEESLIVHRGEQSFVILNLFPYNTGHLMVCPYRHVADYTDLTVEEVHEVAELTRTAMRVVREVSAPAGFNLGMNQGEVAGAGIAAHLHQHVVPRWMGDTNFLPIIGRTKALPILLADTRHALAAAWPAPAGP
ncbi:HIT family hydrolase [Brachybacterium phenoliresistens]|uniref:HIT family hydrolase n=2 Tax=Brachybacterium phenoliresistens TaxID=396014 RepID=Z9JX27_9MICO|nr:HIT family hydrolase [Brachybacterium phenoliresistens]